MSVNSERVRNDFAQFFGVTAVNGVPGTSLTLPSAEALPQNRGRRAPSEDHLVWSASVKCWSIHQNLTEALEADLEIQNGAVIEALGAERSQAILHLAETRSEGINGLLIKKNILALVPGSYDETYLLLKSCLSDCDRLIGRQEQFALSDLEPDLAASVGRFFQTVDQLDDEADDYDAVTERGIEAELSKFFSTIENLACQLESAVKAVADHPAMTFNGLNAKLTVFEMCEECGGDGRALLSLQNSMFRDCDRLLQQHLKKRICRPLK